MTNEPEQEPLLQLELQSPPTPGPDSLSVHPGLKYLALAALGGIMLLVSALGTGTHQDNAAPATTPPILEKAADGDHVDVAKRALIDGQFAAYTGKLLPLPLDKPEAREAFLSTPYLSPEQKHSLLQQAESGQTQLAAVRLWDNFDEDGDVVSIQSGGVTITVPLMHAPTTVYLPYTPGGALLITGVRDGTGGITAAIETGAGAVPLPVLMVGQTISLPLL